MSGNRFSTRLSDYDYRYGAFFITIAVENRLPLFGQIVNGYVCLSPEGQIVAEEWLRTPIIRKEIILDEWIVMPDHFHAIIFIDNGNGPVGGACWRACPSGNNEIPDNTNRIRSIQPISHSLSKIVNQFKATTTRRINEMRGTLGQKIWQRNYHDRIIRNEVELDKVRQYIRNNPLSCNKVKTCAKSSKW